MSAFAKQAFTLIPRGFFLPKLNKPSRVADDLGGRGGGGGGQSEEEFFIL